MPQLPAFFLPFLQSDFQESAYAHLARKCNRPVPAAGARIFSVSFELNGFIWIARVGECLKGNRPGQMRHGTRGRRSEDPAMVVAIFPGAPYCVVTDGAPGRGSHFDDIFSVTPLAVELFVQ